MSAGADDGRSSEEVAAIFERRWALLVAAIIVLLLAVIVFTAVHWSSMPPSRVEVIDSTTLHRGGEFVESNLGTAVDDDGRVVVRVLAEQYAFHPSCIVVPEGVPVTFRVTSSDVVHGFQIFGTNVNTMVVPGYVSTFVATLRGAGERKMPCHEFCGVGHAAMWARVRITPQAEFAAMMRKGRRASCA
jgi:cytochrome c oxidase subunit 2